MHLILTDDEINKVSNTFAIIDFDHQTGQEVSSTHKSARTCPEKIDEVELKCVCLKEKRIVNETI